MKNRAFLTSPDSPAVGDWVVELVGLEPTTKVLWNMVGVRPAHPVGHPASSSKRPAVDGHFYKRESRVAVTQHGKSRCFPHDGSLFPPRRHHHWALPLLLRAASHDR